ncbi:MAG: carbamoylphosphate synthase large subunit [Lachnospiraceae bacterium]|nr:carbamoylphosphate synthase large subunit [Lachnospiraceae bacterium]
MNFIFISPNFPHTYWNFCDRLKRNGVNVLGIGDAPYDGLEEGLKGALTEYYKVDSLEDYDQVFRAVAFFSFKYGKIDWIESLNEYWLEQDARLRTDFNVTTGIQSDRIGFIKNKSLMKQFYIEGGIPTARQSKVTTIEAAREFLKTVDYPVIVKPDVGVGAADTWKLKNDADLEAFYAKLPEVPYVMEEFIDGDLISYEAILDRDCEPLFENMTVWPVPVMDIVNDDLNLKYYVAPDVPEELREAGRRTCKAFGVDRRYVHLEFFRLRKTRKGLGKKGQYAGLEVNMRPPGGYTPDMMNFAHSTDVYQIYADMVAFNERRFPVSDDQYYCVYAGRKDGPAHVYTHTHEEIMERYGSAIVMQEEMPPVNWPQMGRVMYTAKFRTLKETEAFIDFVQG